MTSSKAQSATFPVQVLCRVLEVAPSGYYAWLKQPLSNRAREDARLLRLIRASFVASQGIYGAPRVFLDLREAGETCSKHRVARLMRENRLRALHGYRTRRWSVGKPAVLIPNLLQRRFTVSRPNRAWVTDITYVRTWQGWLYLAVVMDLFSRKIVGWAARPTIHRELVLDAVLMAVRARRPRGTLIHSDQGTQFGSGAWRRFCRSHRLEPSMSRKGNCWDNAVAEAFFGSLRDLHFAPFASCPPPPRTHDKRDYRGQGRAVSSLTFLSRRDRNDAPRAELNHCVGKAGDVFTIVRDVHHGDLQLPAQAMELGAQRCAKIWIQAGERFIEQQDARLPDECPGQCRALLLAPGQLVRIATT